jgi:deazaflavin-dependent oxidoreductase (nitroreductase family)
VNAVLHSRRLFVLLSRLMAPLIRRRVIRSTRVGGSLCVLRTRGRRTGRVREAALDYASGPDGAILVAAGWGRSTRWYLNLLADPRVEVTCDGRTRAGVAAEVTDPDERMRGLRAILVASGAVGRAYGYDPATVPDERLASDFASIPVVRVRLD